MQGIVVPQDADDLLRIEVHHDGIRTRLFVAASRTAAPRSSTCPRSPTAAPCTCGCAAPATLAAAPLAGRREWSSAVRCSHALAVSAVGPFAATPAAPARIRGRGRLLPRDPARRDAAGAQRDRRTRGDQRHREMDDRRADDLRGRLRADRELRPARSRTRTCGARTRAAAGTRLREDVSLPGALGRRDGQRDASSDRTLTTAACPAASATTSSTARRSTPGCGPSWTPSATPRATGGRARGPSRRRRPRSLGGAKAPRGCCSPCRTATSRSR